MQFVTPRGVAEEHYLLYFQADGTGTVSSLHYVNSVGEPVASE